MWRLIFDWPELVQQGADAVTYFILAALGTVLFVIRLVVSLFGGDASFTLFSLLSVTGFIMGAGWTGLACRIDRELGRITSLVSAVGFGTAPTGAGSA